MLDELENGWYLRSYEHMTSKLHFQKVGALKACRSIEFGRAITFVHVFNGSQEEVRTYTSVENLTSLKAENDILRRAAERDADVIEALVSYVDDSCVDSLCEENAKLRGLVKDMYGFVRDVCELHPSVLSNAHIPEWQITDHSTPAERYAEKMRELGIEVD